MPVAIRTEGLSKSFGRFRAVDDLNLEIREGDVYGFLGLNGAGKTTTIRMMLRLIRPTSGRVTVFGRDVAADFLAVMRQVGALVELPAYYPYLSAEKNLEVLRLATGGVPRSRIGEVLERVGLASRAGDPVRVYSQGMRQRLGIAMALLPRPRLVILDEPANGLDPQGILEVRATIRELNRSEGVTFLLSSHLLHEVELTCNRVGIIRGGRLLLEDTVKGILERTVTGLRVECDDAGRAAALLRGREGIRAVEEEGPGGVRVDCDPAEFPKVNGFLVDRGISVSELRPLRKSLEEFFLSQ